MSEPLSYHNQSDVRAEKIKCVWNPKDCWGGGDKGWVICRHRGKFKKRLQFQTNHSIVTWLSDTGKLWNR